MLKRLSLLSLPLWLVACGTPPSFEPAEPRAPVAAEPPPESSGSTAETIRPAPSAPAPASMPDGVSYAGGDGSSTAQAVIVNGVVTTDRGASTRAEYAWLRNRYPGFRRRDQALVRSAGRYYDALTIDLPGGGSRTVYFDITRSFGKR